MNLKLSKKYIYIVSALFAFVCVSKATAGFDDVPVDVAALVLVTVQT